MDAAPVGVPEFQGQGDLGVFGAHAEEGGHPHPEHGSRSANKDGPGDAGDVAGAYGGGQGGGHGLERRHRALAGLLPLEHLAHGVLHGVAEVEELYAAVADGQEQPA